jgi:hypothetical protein
MLARWIPVRLKTRHRSSGIGASPIVSADDHAGIRRSRQRVEDARERRSCMLDVSMTFDEGAVAIRRIVTHVTGRAEAVLEQPCLDVEAVRVHGAVRALEPDNEPPALARG